MLKSFLVSVAILISTAPLAGAQTCPGNIALSEAHDAPIGAPLDLRLLDEALRHVTNLERCANGLTALAADPALISAATGHSEAMVAHGFMAHESPVAGRELPADRLKAAGVRYSAIGENLVNLPRFQFGGAEFFVAGRAACHFSRTPDGAPIAPHTYRTLAHEALRVLIKSEGHAKNILKPGWTRVGHGGAMRETDLCGEIAITQNFVR